MTVQVLTYLPSRWLAVFVFVLLLQSMSTASDQNLPAAVGFLAGGITGVISRFLFYPFDTIKARLQVEHSTASKQAVFTALKQIWRKEGIRSFYSGFGSVFILAIPGNACYFGGFEIGRNLTPEIYPLQDISSGVTAQLLGNLIYTPMDVIKERRQTGVLQMNPLFTRQGRRQLFNIGSLQDLFRGYWLSNSLWIPWSALYAIGYNTMKAKVAVYHDEMPPWTFFTCSTIAAGLATMLTHPIDVVKTQLQVFASEEKSLQTTDVMRRLMEKEGLRGFYRGFTARLITVSPSAGLSWLLYEMTRPQSPISTKLLSNTFKGWCKFYQYTTMVFTSLQKLEKFDIIGIGSFARIQLVRHEDDGNYYALKIMNKAQLLKLKQEEHILSEKAVLAQIQHPFITNLYASRNHPLVKLYFRKGSFQDNLNLYLVLEFAPGGDLFFHMRRLGRFSASAVRFYIASLTLVLEHLHNFNIVYRDLKPENVVLDSNGYPRLTDFGFAKKLKDRLVTWTLCGTPEYLAPEVIQSRGHGVAADFWSLGVMFYELLEGSPPFTDDNPFVIYQQILSGRVSYPKNIDPWAKAQFPSFSAQSGAGFN
eukprot:g257.t1